MSYRQDVDPHGPKPDEGGGKYVWAALEVKICVQGGDEIDVSTDGWSLSYKDGARITPSDLVYDSFPRPKFPDGDTPVPDGSCVRGNIAFAVPSKQRPTTVVYSPESLPKPVTWRIPAGS